ncbi:hypothetical protein MSEO_25500 [Mycobacterium seoulense]|uniref:Uncharacterized protein n=1 Tax=Mycobacterium seoulense TaxID=386911 RepID=A0A7I7NZM5_9MYCO|nr:hypothetical protein MSEO_25500 [Mycobacterium seoulense]
MLGMPSAPGAFTIIAGGGADKAGSATWKAIGERSAGTTAGPERSGTDGETAATGAMLACTGGSFSGSEGAAPLTAPAKTRGVMVATPNARERVT